MRTPHLLRAFLFLLLSATAFAQSATSRLVRAADAFLATLDEKQRQAVVFAFDNEKQRALWSNLPEGNSVRRGGISLKQMNATQRTAAMAMLAVALSPRGFEKIQEIVEAEEVLKNGRENSAFGGDIYFFSFLGKPSETQTWMLQFGGHHLALNITIAGERGILTPSLTGAQPARFERKGKTVRPLGQESDKGLALLNALDEAQRKRAILDYTVREVVLGPGKDGQMIQPEGLKASDMNERQRALLLDVISEWSGIVHEKAAAARLAEIKAGLNETWFAWSGPTTGEPGNNITAYYRIQGPKLIIEYAPQASAPTMHVHAMYRDPTNDYGRGPVKR